MSNVSSIRKDPFSKGVWVLIILGGCDVIALVEENQSKQDLLKELIESKCVCVTLKKRYVLRQVLFPMPEMSNGKHTGGWNVGSIPNIGKHEINLELLNEFPVYASLNNIAFIDEFDPGDVDKLRTSVINADNAAETAVRASKANILMPNLPRL